MLLKAGFQIKRYGSNHDIYNYGSKTIPVPRHTKINEGTAKKLLKDAGIE